MGGYQQLYLSFLVVFLFCIALAVSRTLYDEFDEPKFSAREILSTLFELRGLCEIAPKSPLCIGKKR